MELAHCVADAQVVGGLGCLEFALHAILRIFEIAVEEHALALAASEILILGQTVVADILAELLHGHTQLEVVELAGGIVARRTYKLAVVAAVVGLGVVEELLGV